jgi:ubiquinone/menaquinone biosynthesis C-methylase UbiE
LRALPKRFVFLNCEIYGLDPLIADYARIGYLMTGHDRYQFLGAAAEKIPFAGGAIEAVISVNSIDHVDDLKSASNEIRRVLRNDGLFRMHVNYHSKAIAEPQVLSDRIFRSLFSWVPNLRKISESGPLSSDDVDNHALWSNF